MKKFKIISSAFIAVLALNSCNRNNIDTVNSPIPYSVGGYSSSDAIAPDHLISKLSFENNATDTKSGLMSTSATNANFTAGVKGNCWNGSSQQQRYAVYKTSAAVSGLSSFTYSFWMNTAGTVDPATPGQGKGAQGIFELVDPTGFWGKTDIFLDNPDAANPGRLQLKLHVFNSRTGVVWRDQWPLIKIDGKQNVWFHVVFTYNDGTGLFQCYINGALAPNIAGPYAPANGYTGGYTWYANDPGAATSATVPTYGTVNLGSPSTAVLGSFQFETNPALNNGSQQDWATDFAGQLDEFRIYNTALTTSQVNALYTLEKLGN